MEPWLDLVNQIVVVDSHSEDGTWETLRERLATHPGAEFHQRPRGLYQSWNYGIGQLKTDFTYISTVGDSITRAGLEHLRGVAAEFKADVVVSKPIFIEEKGGVCSHQTIWPVDDIIGTLKIDRPAILNEWEKLLFQIVNPVDAILGSSASNLYRTDSLQRMPFPTEFGTVGDGAWGLKNAFSYLLAVTPESFSTFRRHAKAYSKSDYNVADLNRRLFELLHSTLLEGIGKSAQRRLQAEHVDCSNIVETVRCRMRWQERLEYVRTSRLPWILNPSAWQARSMRNWYRSKALSQRDAALQKVSSNSF
jgi:glycosyltransferase involved in cell wall biosynthesis